MNMKKKFPMTQTEAEAAARKEWRNLPHAARSRTGIEVWKVREGEFTFNLPELV